MYGKTGLFNHIEVQIAIINSVYKVMVYRFGSNTPFNFRYFVNPHEAIKFADNFLEEYKWRL